MASDIVVQTRLELPQGKTVGPTPPKPPLHIFRPGRRRHFIVKIAGATIEFLWPARATAPIEVVARGRTIWVNGRLTSKTVGPTPPKPPLDEGGVTVVKSAPFTIEIRTGDKGAALIVDIRPRRVRVNGKEWLTGRTVGPTPPKPPVEPGPEQRMTLARPSTGPTPHTPPA